MRRVCLLVAALPLLASAQTSDSRGKELTLGKQLAAEFERGATIVSDPAITGYVDRIARKLASSTTLRTPLTVKVISGREGYAAMLPGGFLDINIRLLQTANSEAELAGVIAHQLGHLELWPERQAKQADQAAIAKIPLVFVGGWDGLCFRGSNGMGVAIPMGFFATSGETEAKADELALGHMEKAGYDPGALVDFYARLPQMGPGTVRKVFAPDTVMSEATRALAESMRDARIFVVTTSEFSDVQKRVAELPPAKPVAARTDAPSLQKRDGK